PRPRVVAQHAQQLQLFYLPPYSPERNPDEFLNQDVNTNAVGRQRPRNKTELMQTRCGLWWAIWTTRSGFS
ncbi:MAG: hypothetical protein BRC44_16160, partial [Cyanobacteria bacterium QS_4_48_99]